MQSVRECVGNGLFHSLKPVCDSDQDVLHTAVPQVAEHLIPKGGAFGFADPEPENVLFPTGVDSKRKIDRLRGDDALFRADLDPDCIKEDNRIDGVKRPALPASELRKHRIRDV